MIAFRYRREAREGPGVERLMSLDDLSGPRRFTRLEVEIDGLEGAPASFLRRFSGGQAQSLFVEGSSCSGCTSLGGTPRSVFDRLGHVFSVTIRCQGKVSAPLLRVADDHREFGMDPSAFRVGRVGVDHGSEERMGESDALPVDLQDPSLDGFVELLVKSGGANHALEL